MESEKHIQLLQLTYAAVLADAVVQFDKENILEKVMERKKAEQMAAGKMKAAQFGITSPEAVFSEISKIYDCANWVIQPEENGFGAEAKACKLCAIAKQMKAPSPCRLYCLDPMHGMVKGLNPRAKFKVEETLWDGAKCRVLVTENTP